MRNYLTLGLALLGLSCDNSERRDSGLEQMPRSEFCSNQKGQITTSSNADGDTTMSIHGEDIFFYRILTTEGNYFFATGCSPTFEGSTVSFRHENHMDYGYRVPSIRFFTAEGRNNLDSILRAQGIENFWITKNIHQILP